MAGAVPDVVTRFVADVLPWVRNVRRASNETEQFGQENAKAALAARRMGLAAKEAAEKAARAQALAAEAAERLKKEEIDAAEAAEIAARAERAVEKASIAEAAAQIAAAEAADEHADQLRDVAVTQRATSGSTRNLISGLRGFMGTLLRLNLMGAAFATVAAGAASSVMPVMSLVNALAPAAGLFASAPAAVLGLAAALVTLTGVMPALKRELSALKPMWDRAAKAAQGAFSAQIHGQVKALARELGGPLRAGMSQVGAALGVMTRRVIEFARSSESVKAVRTIFGSVANAMLKLSPAIRPLLNGIRDLAVAGSGALGQFGAAAGRALSIFGAWMSRLAASGRVANIINVAVGVLRQLGSIAKNVGSILGSVFGAAAVSGGGLLGTLIRLTGQAAAFLKSAEGAKVLRSIFAGLSGVGKALGPVIISLLKGIGTIAPAIGRIATAAGPVLTTAINALAPALAALEPGITALVKGLGQGIAKIAKSGALTTLAKALSGIAIAAAPILPVLGQLIASLITSLAPHLPALTAAIGQLVLSLLPLVPPITQVVIAALPMIPVITQIIQIAAQLATAVLPMLQGQLMLNVYAMKFLVFIAKASWTGILAIVKVAVAVIKAVIGWFASLPDKFRDWFGRAKTAVTQQFTHMVAAAKQLPGKIKSAVGNLGHLLWDAGRKVVQGIIDGIRSMLGSLGSTASSVASTIRAYLPFSPAKRGPLSGNGAPEVSGRRISENLAAGIVRARGVVGAAMNVLAAQVSGGIGPSFAIAGAVGTRGGGGATIVNNVTHVHVAGSVLSERQLVNVVQEHVLRRNARNPSNMLGLPTGR